MAIDQHETQLEANVVTDQGYVDNLFAALARPHLTARKRAQLEASLAHHQDALARAKRALVAYQDDPAVPEVLAVALGPQSLPNNSVPDGNTYGCPPNFDAAEFEIKYGFSIQTALDKVVTGILRPHLGYTAGDVTKQAALIDYFAGKRGFATVAGYFGGWYENLGCVDVTKIHDLGA
jgi:hypothetical protein